MKCSLRGEGLVERSTPSRVRVVVPLRSYGSLAAPSYDWLAHAAESSQRITQE